MPRPSLALMFLFGVFLLTGGTGAQQDAPGHPWMVFVQSDIDATGLDRLIFMDLQNGAENTLDVYGENYTIFGDEVMFYDYANRRVTLVAPDTTLRLHPFIRVLADTYRVDWVLDSQRIAWTITSRDPGGQLETITSVAALNGAGAQIVFSHSDPETPELRAQPLAFAANRDTLYMDFQLDGLSAFTPFSLYTRIFALDLTTGAYEFLPDEPANCICGAAIRAGKFARLRLADDLGGFDFHLYDLRGGFEDRIEALRLDTAYDNGGDVLLTPDGRRAVYALSQIEDFGRETQSITTVFVLVDLLTMTQTNLTTTPIRTFVVPVDWTEDNSALLLTNPTQDGTWKINLSDGRLERVAEATYVGRING